MFIVNVSQPSLIRLLQQFWDMFKHSLVHRQTLSVNNALWYLSKSTISQFSALISVWHFSVQLARVKWQIKSKVFHFHVNCMGNFYIISKLFFNQVFPYICLNAKDHRTFWNSTDNNVEVTDNNVINFPPFPVTANFAFNLPFSLGFYIPYILKRLPCGPCRKSYEKPLKFTHTWHFMSNPCCLSLIVYFTMKICIVPQKWFQ